MGLITRTRKIGGSLVITLPMELVKMKEIREGEMIEINIRKKKKDYFGALKGIGSFSREDRTRDRNL